MPNVDVNKYGSARPKITRDDLQDGDFIILTVANFDEATISDEEGKRVTPYLEFAETGDKVLWLNKTQVGFLIEGFGSKDSDDWKGKSVPIEKVTTTYNGRKFDKVAVAAPERWEEYMDAAGLGKPKRKPRAATTKRKK